MAPQNSVSTTWHAKPEEANASHSKAINESSVGIVGGHRFVYQLPFCIEG